MLVFRIAGVLVAIALGVCVVLWLTTGERKWLRYAWHIFRVALALLVGFLLLLFGERLLVARGVVVDELAERSAGGRVAHARVQSAQRIEPGCGQFHSLLPFRVKELAPQRGWLHPYGN